MIGFLQFFYSQDSLRKKNNLKKNNIKAKKKKEKRFWCLLQRKQAEIKKMQT